MLLLEQGLLILSASLSHRVAERGLENLFDQNHRDLIVRQGPCAAQNRMLVEQETGVEAGRVTARLLLLLLRALVCAHIELAHHCLGLFGRGQKEGDAVGKEAKVAIVLHHMPGTVKVV